MAKATTARERHAQRRTIPPHLSPYGAPGATLRCVDLGVTLDGATGAKDVLRGVNFEVEPGSFLSVLGQSGSGKTTLLRALAGLQPASSGGVEFNGKNLTGPEAGVAIVFQDYANALLPWRSVARNVVLGIEGKLPKRARDERVREALQLVGLQHVGDEYPWRLSGGMQQRVQIARAIAMRPKVLLMDEPFGALDAMTKSGLQDQLIEIQRNTGTTVIFITHDVDEAVYLSDRVLVLEGTPSRVGLELTITVPRPRDQVLTREDRGFLEARHRVYAAIHPEAHP